jgi:hypothetical protein
MSWNVSGWGKPEPLAAKLAIEFEKITHYGMRQEELDLAMMASEIVFKSLKANNQKGQVVRVEANGSMSWHPSDGTANTLSIKIEPMWGFVEAAE